MTFSAFDPPFIQLQFSVVRVILDLIEQPPFYLEMNIGRFSIQMLSHIQDLETN
jgi:hypothetical protein